MAGRQETGGEGDLLRTVVVPAAAALAVIGGMVALFAVAGASRDAAKADAAKGDAPPSVEEAADVGSEDADPTEPADPPGDPSP